MTSNAGMSGDYKLALHLWFEKDMYEIPLCVPPIQLHLYSAVWTEVWQRIKFFPRKSKSTKAIKEVFSLKNVENVLEINTYIIYFSHGIK